MNGGNWTGPESSTCEEDQEKRRLVGTGSAKRRMAIASAAMIYAAREYSLISP
jgi:hypothetical protein